MRKNSDLPPQDSVRLQEKQKISVSVKQNTELHKDTERPPKEIVHPQEEQTTSVSLKQSKKLQKNSDLPQQERVYHQEKQNSSVSVKQNKKPQRDSYLPQQERVHHRENQNSSVLEKQNKELHKDTELPPIEAVHAKEEESISVSSKQSKKLQKDFGLSPRERVRLQEKQSSSVLVKQNKELHKDTELPPKETVHLQEEQTTSVSSKQSKKLQKNSDLPQQERSHHQERQDNNVSVEQSRKLQRDSDLPQQKRVHHQEKQNSSVLGNQNIELYKDTEMPPKEGVHLQEEQSTSVSSKQSKKLQKDSDLPQQEKAQRQEERKSSVLVKQSKKLQKDTDLAQQERVHHQEKQNSSVSVKQNKKLQRDTYLQQQERARHQERQNSSVSENRNKELHKDTASPPKETIHLQGKQSTSVSPIRGKKLQKDSDLPQQERDLQQEKQNSSVSMKRNKELQKDTEHPPKETVQLQVEESTSVLSKQNEEPQKDSDLLAQEVSEPVHQIQDESASPQEEIKPLPVQENRRLPLSEHNQLSSQLSGELPRHENTRLLQQKQQQQQHKQQSDASLNGIQPQESPRLQQTGDGEISQTTNKDPSLLVGDNHVSVAANSVLQEDESSRRSLQNDSQISVFESSGLLPGGIHVDVAEAIMPPVLISSAAETTEESLHSFPVLGAEYGKEIFQKMFDSEGSILLDYVEDKIRRVPLSQVLSDAWRDIDQYNLLEKAILYNNIDLVDIILAETEQADDRHKDVVCFRGAIHLACFLGCDDIVEMLLDFNPAMVMVRGEVKIRPVCGPPNDLFSIIGYNNVETNPRLTFQLKWLESHRNEQPAHFAICAGHAQILDLLISQDDALDEQKTDGDLDRGDGSKTERHMFFVDLIRQAASCASSSCLSTLFQMVPDAMYLRDSRGWLLITNGLAHGSQFIRFLLEKGFSVKMFNNMDGRGSVTALHVFYNCLSRDDGIISKYTELYDVTTLLVDIGVDINKETTAFRSHGLCDTPLHILINHVNLLIPCIQAGGDHIKERESVQSAQRFFDGAIKDTILLLLECGFDIRMHQESLLRLLFTNRHYARRYELKEKWPFLREHGCGLRNMMQVSKILVNDGVYLSPRRREMTPSLSLINGLGNITAAKCVFNDKMNSLQFQMCLQILMQNGDNANIYPFSPTEDSYIGSPLIHLTDIYLDHLCSHCGAEQMSEASVDSLLHVADVLCKFGAQFVCVMNMKGIYVTHGVFDGCCLLLGVIQRDLKHTDQCLNYKRLRILKKLVSHLAQNGAEPILRDYVFHNAAHAVPGYGEDFTLLYQVLCIGITCSLIRNCISMEKLVYNKDFLCLLEILLHLASHETFYTCLGRAIATAEHVDTHILENDFVKKVKRLGRNPRKLKELCRCILYNTCKTGLRNVVQELLLPTHLKDYLTALEQ